MDSRRKDEAMRVSSSSISIILAVFCFIYSGQAEGAAGPKLSVSSTLNFGLTPLGSSSQKELTIKNSGDEDLVVSAATVSGSDFSVVAGSCGTVSAGGSCVMTLAFTPSACASKANTGALTISSNDSRSPKSVKLKGSCPCSKISKLPKVIDFGVKDTGGSYAKSFTIVNKGGSPLSLSSFALTNDDLENQDFSLSDDTTCQDASLAKGESCIVWIYFKPTNAGDRTGSLAFSYGDEASGSRTADIGLKGKAKGASSGEAPVIHSFSASPAAVALGSSTTLSWNVSSAVSLSIDQGVGTVSGSSVAVTPTTTGDITYTLTAVNSYGTSSATATVSVSSSESVAIDPSSYATSVAQSASTYDPEDIVGDTTFEQSVYIDFSASTARLSTGAALAITSEGATLLTEGDNSIVVAKSDFGVSITSTVDSAVSYTLSGVLEGTLTVSSSSPYGLYLNGATVNGSSGPAFNLDSSQKVFIVTAPDTVNTLTDQSSRNGMTMKAALFGKGPMIFSGDGTITVTGNYKHAIFSSDYIRIRGGTLKVCVTAKDAVRSVNGIIFDDGSLTVNATGTTIDDESKGLKVEGSDDADDNGAGKGYIVINGGYLTVTSVSKAITASWDIDEDPVTTTTTDDPSPYVEINNGVITITTTGDPYEYISNGSTVSCSPEGIEAKSDLVVNNGYLSINATDDALNAGSSITINSGYIYAASSTNDAIDSNGPMSITGGVTVAIGAAAPEAAFDCDQSVFSITGGAFVGIAGSTSTPTAAASTQNSVILGSKPAGSTIALKDNEGGVAFGFTVPQSYAAMLLSSPDIETGAKYTVYSGGIITADYAFNGLYLGNMSYSGGTAGSSFTVSNRVTQLGQ